MNPEKSSPEKKLTRWLLLATIVLLLLVLGLQIWQISGGRTGGAPQTQDAPAPAASPAVSPGKAAMIEDVRTLNSALSAEDLAALSAEELEQLWEAGAPGLPVGLSAAALSAEVYAGTLEMDSITWDADPELDETPAHYDVELHHITLGDFTYKVDAYTGEVLEGRANLFQNVPTVPDAGQTPDPGGTESRTAETSSSAEVPSSTQTPPAAQTQPPVQTGGPVDEEGAKAAAFAHAGVSAGDAASLRVKLDRDDGVQVYEIEFTADGVEYDYEIDAATGAVRKAGQKWNKSRQLQNGSLIGEEAAKTAAFTHAGVSAQEAGYIRWELDRDDGVQVYEIEFTAGGVEYGYEIDAVSGAVLKAERDAD